MNRTSERLVHDSDGLNTGTLPDITRAHFVTPVARFFTRSHAPVPVIDAAAWRLDIGGLVKKPMQLALNDLSTFPVREVTATLVCAGLRRSELLTVAPMPGELPWGPEPASTGVWTGVALSDVLRSIEIGKSAKYVEFLGLDRVERQGHVFAFGGSIDLDKALDGDVLLATQLNSGPLPPEHGFPVRAVVPGWIGARSVKWLGRITLRADPSDNYFQTKAYRVQREPSTNDPRDVSAGTALSGIALNAVILEPRPGAPLAPGPVAVRGWAIGSAGRPVTKVEVSPNAGLDWIEARIVVAGTGWSWSFWEATVRLPAGRHSLTVRAADGSDATQPVSLEEAWNVKGYGNNAWHRMGVEVRGKR